MSVVEKVLRASSWVYSSLYIGQPALLSKLGFILMLGLRHLVTWPFWNNLGDPPQMGPHSRVMYRPTRPLGLRVGRRSIIRSSLGLQPNPVLLAHFPGRRRALLRPIYLVLMLWARPMIQVRFGPPQPHS